MRIFKFWTTAYSNGSVGIRDWLGAQRAKYSKFFLYIPIVLIVLGILGGIGITKWIAPTTDLVKLNYLIHFLFAGVLIGLARFQANLYEMNSLINRDKELTQNQTSKKSELHSLLAINNASTLRTDGGTAILAINRFVSYWKILVFIWLFYYGSKTLQSFTEIWLLDLEWFNEFLFNTLNNLSSFCVLSLYFLLWRPVQSVTNGKWMFSTFHTWIFWVLVALTVLDFGVKVSNPSEAFEVFYNFSLSVMSGIFAMLSLSLFTGRADSKFLCPNPAVIIVLYLYATVQLFYPFVNLLEVFHREIFLTHTFVFKLVVLYFALFSKIVLYGFLAWGFARHRMLIALIRLVNWSEPLGSNRKELEERLVRVYS
jgi:hypothetical protein